jgi:hypothetical protein
MKLSTLSTGLSPDEKQVRSREKTAAVSFVLRSAV